MLGGRALSASSASAAEQWGLEFTHSVPTRLLSPLLWAGSGGGREPPGPCVAQSGEGGCVAGRGGRLPPEHCPPPGWGLRAGSLRRVKKRWDLNARQMGFHSLNQGRLLREGLGRVGLGDVGMGRKAFGGRGQEVGGRRGLSRNC